METQMGCVRLEQGYRVKRYNQLGMGAFLAHQLSAFHNPRTFCLYVNKHSALGIFVFGT